MGHCKSNCKDSCDDCPDQEEPTPFKIYTRPQEEDISVLLAPSPKPRKDGTPLEHPCNCKDGVKDALRYHCLHCIRSWVEAVCTCTANCTADRMESFGHKMAAMRIREALEDKRRRNVLRPTTHTCTICDP